jgi:hypothetical protein
MKADHVLINGSLMDRIYFEESLAEAKSVEWARAESDAICDHKHCIICTKAISLQPLEECYRSGHRYLCGYCHSHYV